MDKRISAPDTEILHEAVELPLMSLRDAVMTPHAVIPFFVGREASIHAIEAALKNYGRKICLVSQKDAATEKPEMKDLHSMGVVCRVVQFVKIPDSSTTYKAILEGLYRVSWESADGEVLRQDPFPVVLVRTLEEPACDSVQAEAFVNLIHEYLEEYARANKKLSLEIVDSLKSVSEPGKLADMILPMMRDSRKLNKQMIHETLDPLKRITLIYRLMQEEVQISNLEQKIRADVKEQMDRNQREYYLSEQMKAITKELGREVDPSAEVDELEKRIQNKAKFLPSAALDRAMQEVRKLRIPGQGSENAISRNYIEWILNLPWNELKDIDIDLARARSVLDRDHFGLEKTKERILEFLAVQKLNGGIKGPILCLVGPPGVGKTSLARSIADATGREYVRLSLGGVHDEAEIRGHRRTYIGSMPGRIISSLRRAQSSNPLFCLDEIDKLSADFRGDPASALLEVLDPEQNATFCDNYLDLDYDLSKVFFITTANTLQGIPLPLQDRMEIIEIPSYLETEKKHIARDFLLPKQIREHGLDPKSLRVSDDALTEIIRGYTLEAGVRSLERELAHLCRKTAIDVVEHPKKKIAHVVTPRSLEKLLGVRRYRIGESEKKSRVGVVNGLAYTSVGGVMLQVETAIMPGKGNVMITGKVGDVMNESARAALSYVRSRTSVFGLRQDFYDKIDIHVHFPEAATPKDGPSAGVTITTALVSALTGIPVCYDVAMTGEVTLRGNVLPIGGLREKLLAASRAGMKRVLIPSENARDLKEIPQDILRNLDVCLMDHMDDVLKLALETAPDFAECENSDMLVKTLRSGTASSAA
ncbi:MAG: endopeptidase La [Desulfovibrionaceae bacterium]|nr:endopeptidase La [Desulfovibrionaceae bacterium]